MSRLWTLLLGVAVFSLIAGLCTRWHRPAVESAVIEAARAQLASAGIEGVEISHPGRHELVLRGVVADQATRSRIETTVLAHPLVARVSNRIEAPRSSQTIDGLAGRVLLAEDSFESSIGALRGTADCRAELRDHMRSQSVEFEAGSVVIAAPDRPYLEHTVELLQACPGARLRLVPRMAVDEPTSLGEQRARAVMAALEGLGVARERLAGISPSDESAGPIGGVSVELWEE